jgi:hypothetical protein
MKFSENTIIISNIEIYPKQVLIYMCVINVPDNPQACQSTLGKAFCSTVLQEDFWPQPELSGYNHIHIPPDFDSSQPLKRWFILDLNRVERPDKIQVSQIPYKVYFASYQQYGW